MPWVAIAPPSRPPASELAGWIRSNAVDELVWRHGALLFRGFAIDGVADFRIVADALGTRQNYVGGNSPRTLLVDRIYSSTEYPRRLELAPHNEMAYLSRWPSRLAFCCMTVADEGGETPLADCRAIPDLLDPSLRTKLGERRVTYVRNLHGGGGTGLTWQESFGTADPGVVEELCRGDGVSWTWRDGNLRTSIVCDAFTTHPHTNQLVWFNQIVLWHHSTLHPRLRDSYEAAGMRPDDFPHACFYGDGSVISDDEVEQIRACVAQATHVFPWERGDVLAIDNALVAHGRRPFRGEREVVVALFR